MKIVLPRSRLAAALLALAAGCAGCAARRDVAVELFLEGGPSPAVVRVAPGARVVFHNAGLCPLTVQGGPASSTTTALKAESGSGTWVSGLLYPGETWSREFPEAGTSVFSSACTEGFQGEWKATANSGVIEVGTP